MKLTKKEVSKYIPRDISFDILSKLPLKSLKRFTCVCKFWTNLFEKPEFMRMYRKHLSTSTYDDHNSRLLFKQTPAGYMSDEDNLYILSNETFENSIKLDWPPPFESHHIDMCVFDSVVNGILCVYQGSGSCTSTLFGQTVVLWSQSTDEFKVIPDGSIEHLILKAFPPGTVFEELPIIPTFVGIHGFCYDPVTDDYKLIRRFGFSLNPQNINDDIVSFWQIYSLKSNCWRDLQVEVDMPGNMGRTVDFAVNLHGMCHWLGNVGTIVGEDELVSFNLSDETFIRTPLIHVDDGPFIVHLVVLKESIALMEMDDYGGYLISILGELGVAESLTRLFRTGILPDIQEIIGVGKNGNIFYVTGDEEIAKYNLNTEMNEEIGVRGRFGSCQMVIYNESLLPMEGILS
ncbi:F-box only protein 8-like [Trifolium pratense]|uniref:F-box only protein 8-like n=1 Tax=Trifolium pratense TaxID=57577 RepID=UPI001E692032|nr:F-box only protein 8-like [Trifolium pratense]